MSSLHSGPMAGSHGSALSGWVNVVVGTVLLVLALPLLALVALAVRLTSHGRVIERRPHRTQDGSLVQLLGFRTTLDGARTTHHARLRAAVGVHTAPRTPIGPALRLLRLDRLPRLVNVAAGHVRLF